MHLHLIMCASGQLSNCPSVTDASRRERRQGALPALPRSHSLADSFEETSLFPANALDMSLLALYFMRYFSTASSLVCNP
jgi:hypothetical protein